MQSMVWGILYGIIHTDCGISYSDLTGIRFLMTQTFILSHIQPKELRNNLRSYEKHISI